MQFCFVLSLMYVSGLITFHIESELVEIFSWYKSKIIIEWFNLRPDKENIYRRKASRDIPVSTVNQYSCD